MRRRTLSDYDRRMSGSSMSFKSSSAETSSDIKATAD